MTQNFIALYFQKLAIQQFWNRRSRVGRT